MRISNDQNEGFTGTGTSGWHIDGAYTEKPFAFLIFHVIQVPTTGDTKYKLNTVFVQYPEDRLV